MEKGMEKFFIAIFAVIFLSLPSFAAPGRHAHGGPGMRPPMGSMHRPPMARPPFHARPPMHHHIGQRPPLPPLLPPPIYRPYNPMMDPFYRPYYPRYYSTYIYTPAREYYDETVVPVSSTVNTVVVKDDYAGVNAAANVINAASNAAATIKYLSW